MAKTVLVTGASKGIGAAVVRRFNREGYSAVAVSRSLKQLEETFKNCDDITSMAADVSSPKEVDELVNRVEKKFGTVDVVVNSAGLGYFGTIAETSPEVWNQILAVNLTGTFLVCKAMLPLMTKSDRPHLFNILSAAAKTAFPNCGAYVASKFGALGFTDVLREELRPLKIKVTAVLPGAVDTPFWDTQAVDFDRAQMLRAGDVAESIWQAYQQPANSLIEEISIKPSRGDF